MPGVTGQCHCPSPFAPSPPSSPHMPPSPPSTLPAPAAPTLSGKGESQPRGPPRPRTSPVPDHKAPGGGLPAQPLGTSSAPGRESRPRRQPRTPAPRPCRAAHPPPAPPARGPTQCHSAPLGDTEAEPKLPSLRGARGELEEPTCWPRAEPPSSSCTWPCSRVWGTAPRPPPRVSGLEPRPGHRAPRGLLTGGARCPPSAGAPGGTSSARP